MVNKLIEQKIILTEPKKWTKEEEQEVLRLKESGLNSFEIADKLKRSQVSVSIKLKRLTKNSGSYNEKHVFDKYEHNQKFLDIIKPKIVLDCYAGNSWYKGKVKKLVTNDIDKKFNCDSDMPAFEYLCMLNYDKVKVDLVDLDPFGSAIEEFHLAVRIAKKGIIITLGEIGAKRWKRLDFVKRWYNIQTMKDFTVENMIKELQRIGLCHKKELEVIYQRDYQRISRVWFKINPVKIEVWERARK